MRSPDRGFVVRAEPPSREERADIGIELGLHEHLGESRMRGVGGVGREHQFRVRGQLDFARAISDVGDRYAADFGVVLGRDSDFERGGEGAVAADYLGAIFGELDIVTVGLDAAWLITRRPDFAAGDVAQGRCTSPTNRK